jgi:UDP-N-acetylenolpyruvoylglucosamine reductase
MNIRENVSLATYTTFRIGGSARFFVDVESDAEKHVYTRQCPRSAR